MSGLNSLVADLRQKRLWPVAVGLLVALAAVPVLLSKSTTRPPVTPALTAPVVSPATAVPAVSLASDTSHSRLTGPARDPFTQQQLPVAKRRGSAASTSARRAAAGATRASTNAASSSAGSTGDGGSVTAAPSIKYFDYTVDLAFARIGTPTRSYGNVSRLTPLPSPKNPVIVFLGLRQDAKTAVFLVSGLATPTGAGQCTPSPRECQFLSLKVGQSEVILTQSVNGAGSEYGLHVSAVHLVPTSSASAVPQAHASDSSPGGPILPGAHE